MLDSLFVRDANIGPLLQEGRFPPDGIIIHRSCCPSIKIFNINFDLLLVGRILLDLNDVVHGLFDVKFALIFAEFS